MITITVRVEGLAPVAALWRDVVGRFRLRYCNPSAPHYGEYIVKHGTRKGLWL